MITKDEIRTTLSDIRFYYANGIKRKIEQKIKLFSDATIVFCFGSDDIFVDTETVSLNKKIEKYCKSNGYKIVWFCRDIEEVFLHRKVEKSEKIISAAKFNVKKGLGEASVTLLNRAGALSKQTSNFTCVFDALFNRKP